MDLNTLTRKESAQLEFKKKEKRNKLYKLEDLENALILRTKKFEVFLKISNLMKKFQDCQKTNKLKIDMLGYDRFYRRYWYFYNSSNTGIFIEEVIFK